jgi:hypothetical protein
MEEFITDLLLIIVFPQLLMVEVGIRLCGLLKYSQLMLMTARAAV